MVDIADRVSKLEREMTGIAELIQMESRLNQSRFAALFADIDAIKRDVKTIQVELMALPRTLAEMLAERDKSR